MPLIGRALPKPKRPRMLRFRSLFSWMPLIGSTFCGSLWPPFGCRRVLERLFGPIALAEVAQSGLKEPRVATISRHKLLETRYFIPEDSLHTDISVAAVTTAGLPARRGRQKAHLDNRQHL